MRLEQSDWDELARNLPKELTHLCDLAGTIQYKVNRIEGGLRINYLYPEDVTDVLADARDLTLEYISIIQAKMSGEQTDVLVTDLQEIFKLTDQERERLANSFNSRQYGQIYITLQKVKELLHGYIYNTIHQAKVDWDNKFMQTFIKTALSRRGIVPPAEEKTDGGSTLI